MSQPISIITEVTVNADLNKIIKYHPSSSIFLNEKSAIEYVSTFNIKMLLMEENGQLVPKSDYRYSEIVDLCLPESTHENTLLVLVKNMIEINWGYYTSYFLVDDDGKQLINLHEEIKAKLEELKILTLIKEGDNFKDVETKIKLRETISIDRNTSRRYDVKGMQVELLNAEENKEITELLIRNRIIELCKPDYKFYPLHDVEILDWSSIEIEKAIFRMKQPFRDYRAQWLFCKSVSETVLKFLKGEMEWNQGNIDITDKQGIFIYTLLILFHLLDPVEELKFKSNRDKAKYIRSFFRKDLINIEERFYEFGINKVPYDDLN